MSRRPLHLLECQPTLPEVYLCIHTCSTSAGLHSGCERVKLFSFTDDLIWSGDVPLVSLWTQSSPVCVVSFLLQERVNTNKCNGNMTSRIKPTRSGSSRSNRRSSASIVLLWFFPLKLSISSLAAVRWKISLNIFMPSVQLVQGLKKRAGWSWAQKAHIHHPREPQLVLTSAFLGWLSGRLTVRWGSFRSANRCSKTDKRTRNTVSTAVHWVTPQRKWTFNGCTDKPTHAYASAQA